MPGIQSGITFQSSGVSQQTIGEFSGVLFDAATGTYTVTFFPSPGGPGIGSDPSAARTLTYTPAQITSNSGNFTTYQHPDPSDASHTNVLSVFKTGAANSAIALTYASYAFQDVGNGTNFLQRSYMVFGSPVPTVPTTGTASFAGIVDGVYSRSDIGQIFFISGSSTLTANFAAATVATTLSFTGANVTPGQPGLAVQMFSGNGVITATNPGSQFNGTLSGNGVPGSGAFLGNFYGSNAQEFGYGFVFTGANDQASGIAVGKR